MSETGETGLKAGSEQLAAGRKQISSIQNHRCMLRAFWCQLQVYSMLYAPCSMLFHNGPRTIDNGLLELLQHFNICLLPSTIDPAAKSLLFFCLKKLFS